MDRVRLGRVLGRGTRLAARTVYDAMDAAISPSPATAGRQERTAPAATPARQAPHRPPAPPAILQAVNTANRVQHSARAATNGVVKPFKRAVRAVALELAGSFFAIFAVSFSVAAWKAHTVAQNGQRLWTCAGLGVLFAYFAVSSFLRARRISRA